MACLVALMPGSLHPLSHCRRNLYCQVWAYLQGHLRAWRVSWVLCHVWRNCVPLQVQFFRWLLVQSWIKCTANLKQKWIVDNDTCVVCGTASDTANNLIFTLSLLPRPLVCCGISRSKWSIKQTLFGASPGKVQSLQLAALQCIQTPLLEVVEASHWSGVQHNGATILSLRMASFELVL